MPARPAELVTLGLAIGFSPPHIGLLLVLLLGDRPLRRGGLLVGVWLLTSALEVGLLLLLGHRLLLTMETGTDHRTALDLLAAGALLALGLRELLAGGTAAGSLAADSAVAAKVGWSQRLESLRSLPLPTLLALSSLVQVLSPDDLFLYAKASSSMLASGLGLPVEGLLAALFSLSSALLLLVPLLGLAVFGQRLLPWLQRAQDWLLAHADLLVGLVSVALAVTFAVQGIEGLRLGSGAAAG